MPVSEHLEFPCEESTLGVMFDPFKAGEASQLASIQGTPDQYAVGDLSGKYGQLDNLSHLDTVVNDTSLSLFGQRSILGRSVVIFRHNYARLFALLSDTVLCPRSKTKLPLPIIMRRLHVLMSSFLIGFNPFQ